MLLKYLQNQNIYKDELNFFSDAKGGRLYSSLAHVFIFSMYIMYNTNLLPTDRLIS